MIQVKATPKFMRLVRKVITPDALQALIDTLALQPEKGLIIPGTGGIRKIRWITGKGVGKSGGLRILYYYNGKQLILLLTMFKKADQENIDAGEKIELRRLINDITR